MATSAFPLYLTIPQAKFPLRAADSLGVAAWGGGSTGLRSFSTTHAPSSTLEVSAMPLAKACLSGVAWSNALASEKVSTWQGGGLGGDPLL